MRRGHDALLTMALQYTTAPSPSLALWQTCTRARILVRAGLLRNDKDASEDPMLVLLTALAPGR